MRRLNRLTSLAMLAFGALGFLALGFSIGSHMRDSPTESAQVAGTSGTIDVAKVRERGADLGEKAAAAAAKAQETVSEAGLTAKIKAKMALDDSVKARAIGVSTEG